MKLARTLVLTGLCSTLTACGGSIRYVEVPVPPELAAPCAEAVEIPGALTQARAEILWMRDRAALRDCRERHAAIVGARD